jgi:hypothetical protein
MKLTTEQQTIAILDLLIEMAAKNHAFQEAVLSSLCANDEEAVSLLSEVKSRTDEKVELLRAKVFQYASVDPNDLLNGLFDF